MQVYSDPSREQDEWSLPNVEIFQLTALEVAEQDEELIWQYMKKPQFRLATMNSRVRESMLEAIVEDEGIQGGWFYQYCFPGCLPDSAPCGPYGTWQEAKEAAQGEQE